MKPRNKAFAFLATAIMLAVPLGYATFTPDVEESEGTPGFVAGFILGAVIFGTTMYFAGKASAPDTSEEDARTAESNALATGIAYANGPIQTAYLNYSTMWKLTSEHWIRQAELCAASEWSADEAWDYTVADRLLTDCSAYINEATLLANAGAQWNSVMDTVSERVQSWEEYDAYKDGGLKLVLTAGSSTLEADSGNLPKFYIGTAVRDVKSGQDRVFYAGGPIYASASCTLTGENGHRISLSAGWNDMPTVSDFQYPGVYTLPSGKSYCGYFQRVEGNGAPLIAGMAAATDGGKLFITYNGSVIRTDSESSVDAITLSVVPKSGTAPDTQDITGILRDYHGLMESIAGTQNDARQAAKVAWSTYTDLGQSSAYLTSLTVPTSQMEGVEWTDDQLKMINYLAMEQAADYYDRHSGKIKTTGYEMSKESLTLYCRGSIQLSGGDSSGKTFDGTSGVAFTPIVFRDYDLNNGSNTMQEYCYIVVWGKCNSLAGFDVTSYGDAEIIYAGAGTVLNVAEIVYDGEQAQTVHLEVSEMDWIDPVKIADPGAVVLPEGSDTAELVRLIFILLGGGLVIAGLGRGSVFSFVLGAVLILVGVLLAGAVAEMLEGWPFYWTFKWP